MRVNVFKVDFHLRHKKGTASPSRSELVAADTQESAAKIAEAEFGDSKASFEVEHIGTVTRNVLVAEPKKKAPKAAEPKAEGEQKPPTEKVQ